MITLAVDTATKAASAAIVDNGEIRTSFLINHRSMHSRNIMTLVDAVVKEADIKKNDIDLFATTIGPGSFTGVRIGVSTVKAMAYSLKKQTVGINTLDVLAYDVYEYQKLICPVLDARNRQVFCAIYNKDKENRLIRLTEYMGLKIDDLMSMLQKMDRDVVFTGDAYKACASWEGFEGFGRYTVNVGDYMPKASTVGLMAETAAKTDPALLMPFYLRKSQAEQAMEVKNE